MNSTSQRERKHTQRERLLRGMIEVAGREGYAEATIAQVIAHAGVSRPTFYDYFAGRDDCFLAALAEVQRRLLIQVRRAVAEERPEHAMGGVIAGLLEFAQAEPTMARMLTDEPAVCGLRALEVRDLGVTEIAALVERAYTQVPRGTAVPDVPPRSLVGGIERLIALRMRRGESLIDTREDLVAWLASYEQPIGEHRWRTLEPTAPAAPSPFLAEIPLLAPVALPPGRSRMNAEEIAENDRRRILQAAAEMAASKGANAVTIAEISELAGVSGRALRRLYADKQEVYGAVHELSFQSVVAVTATAFFAGESWPERVWEAGRAFVQSLEQNRSLAHVTFVEFHSAGAAAVERNNELLLAFTVFLQEGYQYERTGTPPSRLALEAIAAMNFETVYQRIRIPDGPGLGELLAHATFFDLAPFLGPAEANRFIDEKLRE